MHLGDVVDQFHDENGLADAGAAEQADLAALRIGGQQVDDLDAGDQDFRTGRLSRKFRRRLVDRTAFGDVQRRAFINGFTHHVQNPAQGHFADRHHDRAAGVADRFAADQTFGRIHGDGADGVFAKMLRHFQDQLLAVVVGFQRVQDRGQLIFELYVNDGADHLRDFTSGLCHVSTPACQSASAPEMISMSSLVIAA